MSGLSWRLSSFSFWHRPTSAGNICRRLLAKFKISRLVSLPMEPGNASILLECRASILSDTMPWILAGTICTMLSYTLSSVKAEKVTTSCGNVHKSK